MPPPKSEKEIKGFLDRLQYISRFITKLTSTCEPIFKLSRKNEPHESNDECQKAFELIKEYLLYPPILVSPMHGKPQLLYLSIIEDVVGIMLAQEYDNKNKRAVYYLSKRFHDYCGHRIFPTLDLRAGPQKFQKYYLFSMGLRKHLDWHGITCLGVRALEVPFQVKLTKMPLVNPRLTES